MYYILYTLGYLLPGLASAKLAAISVLVLPPSGGNLELEGNKAAARHRVQRVNCGRHLRAETRLNVELR